MWNLESWMARDTQQNIDWLHMMPLFAREHQLDVSCIMTAYNDAESNEFCRELVIGIHSETISKESVLQALIVSELELEPLPSLSRHDIQAFRQRNVKASRKQVHPILSDILEESLKQSRI